MISVIVPTYNRANILIHTLNSILNQTFNDLELIVIDDGSIDNTEDIVRGIKDKRIKYINIEKSGDISKVRNIGLKVSKGDLIAFCDDDDVWMHHKLEYQYQFINQFDFICSNADFIDIDNNILNKPKYYQNKQYDIIDTKKLLLGNEIFTSSVLIKKEILKDGFIEKKSTTSAEDYELWLRLSLNNKICRINNPLLFFRQHNNTSSFNYGVKYIQILNGVLDILSSYKNNKNKCISRIAIYAIVKQRYELCKVYLRNLFLLSFLFEIVKLILNIINPFFIKIFFKIKFKRLYSNLSN